MMERSLAVPFALFLFILPFPGTVALRLVCLSAAFVIGAAMWRKWSTPPIPAKLAIGVWIVVTALAVPYSFDPAYSLGEFKNETFYVLMAYAAFFAFCRTGAELSALMAALGAAVAVIGVWGIAGTLRLGIWNEAGAHGGVGTVSAVLAAISPFFALALFDVRDRRARLLLIGTLVVIFLMSIATRQRILWPLFIAQAAVGILLLRRAGILTGSARRLWVGLALIAALSVALVAGLQEWRKQTHSIRPVEVDARLSVWPNAAKITLEHPLLGEGLGRQAMRKTHPEFVPPEDPLIWHAHNVFLNAGVSMGIPGVLALLLLFGTFLACYARLLRAPERTARLIGIAGILMIVGVVGRNLTNDLFVRDGSLLFWALNGALLGAGARYGAGSRGHA